MGDEPEDPERTPLLCMACGGRGCKWCTRGFQNEDQRREWMAFRKRMQKISSTYPLLEQVVREIMDHLRTTGTAEAVEMASEGQRLLSDWSSADPDSTERRKASSALGIYQKKAIQLLVANR